MLHVVILTFYIITIKLGLPTPIKIYFGVDIDGTFYVEDPEKFKNNVEAFKNLKQNNIVPFFCTGRVLSSAMKVVGDNFQGETGYNGYPGVYANGALVYDSDGNIISHSDFSEEFLRKFVQYIIENNLDDITIFKGADSFYIIKDLREGFIDNGNETKVVSVEKILPEDLYKKKIVIININNNINLTEFDGSFFAKVSSNGKTSHLFPKCVSKEYGTKKLFDHLSMDFDSCSFVGNGRNDMEIMKSCKFSYAVADAVDAAKEGAKKILTKKHDDGGFVEAVDSLISDMVKQDQSALVELADSYA
ncbi:haloacid dehalogenase-like family hydrolase, putative [Theileria annulata]|uniref:Haloacid dehalogenase-like family hydrolase, putative n=1 Tax=Theileria annulata TaxID=5874 RepID=Q4UIS1_THEAN|nr:haloacid dehalogenase-like family hydrolase, putative [Theileria annulata]CAI73018.1 haloacid dehalogenase-like family hydrolase, putative [Theileria annulata]|eukprot:XP_953696.1 haloacid dehalogenase-like family hydrolase, putative [Theileria annulata]